MLRSYALGFALVISVAGAAKDANARALNRYAFLAVSARGDVIAAVEPRTWGQGNRIVLRSSKSGKVLRSIDPCAACSYSDLTYSTAGHLAFLARGPKDSAVSLQLVEHPSAAPRIVASFSGLMRSPRFSPDATKIAVLVTVNPQKQVGSTQAGSRLIGEIGAMRDEQRLAVIDVKKAGLPATVSIVSPEKRYIYEYDWVVDGNSIVVSDATGDGDRQWWVATLDLLDIRTGSLAPIARPSTQIRMPRVSPDGRYVYFIGGLMSDFGNLGGDIWRVAIDGSDRPRNLTPGAPSTYTSITWTDRDLFATALSKDKAQILRFHADGSSEILWSGSYSLGAGDAAIGTSRTGRMIAATAQSFDRAPFILAGRPRSARPIVNENMAVEPLVRSRSLTWMSDGHEVQGWLVTSASPNAPSKPPLIVNVHGGPANVWAPSFITTGGITAALIGAGYALLLPNPHGSFGQGAAFAARNRGDFGGGDLRDIVAGVDAAGATGMIDTDRVGLLGVSYGGFMGMWANTQTHRFKAIVAGAGIANWTSYYGTNQINTWLIPYFGASFYRDPDVYARQSPLTYIARARTPTFLFVGERDIEVPSSQSFEYWNALRELGVPTKLVVYPEEGHEIREATNGADWRRRAVAWFDCYVRKLGCEDLPPPAK